MYSGKDAQKMSVIERKLRHLGRSALWDALGARSRSTAAQVLGLQQCPRLHSPLAYAQLAAVILYIYLVLSWGEATTFSPFVGSRQLRSPQILD